MTSMPWPPPTYFTTANYGPEVPQVFNIVTPLGPVQTKPDGTKYLRFQLPEAPVVAGSVSIAGYLRSTVDGIILNPAGIESGTIDFSTGIFEVFVEYDQSPGLGSRLVEYIKG